MTEENEFDHEEACLRRAGERYDKVIGGRLCEFQRAVKLITHEKRPDRALDWFCRYKRSRAETEECADAEIASLRLKGFHFMQLATLRRDFKEWKRLEKSRSAKQSAEQSVEKRRQQGRVKSNNDKRLGARLPG